MRLSIDVMLDYWVEEAADILLQVEVAAQHDQRLIEQNLTVWTDAPLRAVPGEMGVGQRCLTRGSGTFRAEYKAVVAIERAGFDLVELRATPVRMLPGEVISYLLASRYCEADRFEGFVRDQFPGLDGGKFVAAARDWIVKNIGYQAGTSSGVTTAMMTFAERRGVCRDYAHLLCTLARAGGIPARCVSAYAPNITPQDFHAVCEVWLEGGWRLVDATGMAGDADLARVAVGRDATDIAFMTVFGRAHLQAQRVNVSRIEAGPAATDVNELSAKAIDGQNGPSSTIVNR